MRYAHELRKLRPAQEGCVDHLEVDHLKRATLCSEIALIPEGHWEGDLTYGFVRHAWHDPKKGLRDLCDLGTWDLHLVQSLGGDDVERATTVD